MSAKRNKNSSVAMGASVSADRDATLVIPQASKAPTKTASGSRKLTDRMVRPASRLGRAGVIHRPLDAEITAHRRTRILQPQGPSLKAPAQSRWKAVIQAVGQGEAGKHQGTLRAHPDMY